MMPSYAVCVRLLFQCPKLQCRSLDPASASNKTDLEYLAAANSPELELANGSLCKAWFTKLEKAATYLATAQNITVGSGDETKLSRTWERGYAMTSY